MIKEFEASHGTVNDMWEAHLRGEETSLNPLGMVEALVGAVEHSITLARQRGREDSDSEDNGDLDALEEYIGSIRKAVHKVFVAGKGTRDLAGPSGLTTEDFVDEVARVLSKKKVDPSSKAVSPVVPVDNTVDEQLVRELFEDLDTDKSGSIDMEEFMTGLKRLNACPRKLGIIPPKKKKF